LQNSPEIATSFSSVLRASETVSEPPTRRVAVSRDISQCCMKYRALPLCSMSISVPTATAAIITTT
jgi:hypothetical protein